MATSRPYKDMTPEEFAKLPDEDRRKVMSEIRQWRKDHPPRRLPHAHPELHDPALRAILANELLLLRRSYGLKMIQELGPLFKATVEGMDVALRRVQDVGKYGLEAIYPQNFTGA